MREFVRVTRSGGTIASLEFGVPPAPHWRALWELYVRLALPLAGRAISPGWHEVGRFLGSSIRALPPPEQLARVWRDAALADVRFRRLSLGGGVVMWARRA
jgi:demethylmenaquinone methyltransferase/2-methoxy-6-polyprenyl-1,4-benzoquinol methylase